MRLKARIDANHAAVVNALRKAGCSVQSLAALGKGVPDLLVARCGNNVLLEVKDGVKPPSQRKLTDDEREWHVKWNAPVYTVNSIEEALRAVGL